MHKSNKTIQYYINSRKMMNEHEDKVKDIVIYSHEINI